jgi:hypothetical protein
MNPANCLNCGATVSASFCPDCGQKTATHRLNWHYVWHDIPHSVFHLDKGFLFTIRQMTLRPGKAVNEFLDGKRVNYFRPLMFLIITGSMAGLIYLKTGTLLTNNFARDEETAQVLKLVQQMQGKYFNLVTILLIPIQAFWLWLFYKKERNYVEIFTALFLITGQLNLLSLMNLLFYASNKGFFTFAVSSLSSLASMVYYVFCFTTMFRSRSQWARVLIALAIWVFHTFVTAIIVIGVILFILAWNSPDGSININYGF